MRKLIMTALVAVFVAGCTAKPNQADWMRAEHPEQIRWDRQNTTEAELAQDRARCGMEAMRQFGYLAERILYLRLCMQSLGYQEAITAPSPTVPTHEMTESELNQQIRRLEKEALPRLVERMGPEEGQREFERRVNVLLQVLGKEPTYRVR